ncbi:LysR family transcriptional regulator [Roseicella aquatilis]|uniref:LysR family transcriptional regulator n=1 Tax=Roseicella aquatilis TaxID=2527868 RepID=A0A4R4DAT4_9PROT|nr:LysR family transcriptional regulator [Roseicella aquatilis]TCZ57282.1 LysR family transcriptional regulator [Roseicella aquatilis]
MDLRQLATFLQVAELGSLGKASDRLRIAQPALSRQVRLLEEELRVALFARHGRGMALTAAGERLRLRAAAILRQVEETRADLMQEAGAVRGRVVFGLPPTVGAVLTARLTERFLATYPEVTLRVVQAFSGYLIDWLQGGEIDIAVVYGGAPGAKGETGVRQAPLLNETLHFVTPAGTGLSPHQAITFAEVAEERLLLPGPQHGLRRLVEAEARPRGLALRIAVEADDLPVLKELAMRRLGCTILPLAAVREEVAAGRLCAAPIIDPPLSRRLVVAEPLGRQASNAVAAFGRALREEVAEMVRSGLWNGQLLAGDRNRA